MTETINHDSIAGNIAKVADFHKTSGMEFRTTPGFLDRGRMDLRLDLLEEEVKELEQAGQQKDLAEVLDALVDIQYILHGAILDFGLQDAFVEACAEVHASNMSKFCPDTRDAKESADHYTFDKKTDAYYTKVGKVFVIRRSKDDKILKGKHFFVPKLKEILKKLQTPQTV